MLRLRLHLVACLCGALVVAPACAAAMQDASPSPMPPTAQPPTAPGAAPGAAQVSAATARQPPAQAAPRAADPAAADGLAALARAAQFQRGDQPLGRPTSLHGSFYVGVRDKDGAMLKASVERWYTADPQRLLTRRTESVTGSRSSVGFDGARAWFRDDDSGRVVVYTDAPETYDVDLELLQEQLRLTRLLLDAAVLDALIPRLHDVRAGSVGQVRDPDGESHAVQHVTARVADELFPPAAAPPDPDQPAELALDFAIDAETGALWALAVTAPGRTDVASLDLQFAFHGATRSGLRVPGNIKVFRGGEPRESANLGVEEDSEQHLVFEVDAPVDPALFAVPQG